MEPTHKLGAIVVAMTIAGAVSGCSSPEPAESEGRAEAPIAESAKSVAETNKEVVRSFFAKFNADDVAGAFALVRDSDEKMWWIPGTEPSGNKLLLFSGEKTKTEYLAIVGMIQAGFGKAGLKLTPLEMTAEGDRVAVEVESHGLHIPTGLTYRNQYHFLFVVRNGEIVRVKEYMDTAHLQTLLPKPGP